MAPVSYADLRALKRTDLQAFCKVSTPCRAAWTTNKLITSPFRFPTLAPVIEQEHGIKANGKTEALVVALAEKLGLCVLTCPARAKACADPTGPHPRSSNSDAPAATDPSLTTPAATSKSKGKKAATVSRNQATDNEPTPAAAPSSTAGACRRVVSCLLSRTSRMFNQR